MSIFEKYFRYLVSCRGCYLLLIYLISPIAFADEVDYKKVFSDVDGCFTEIRNSDGKEVALYGQKRCASRFPPCSTFKIPLAFISFEESIFQNPETHISWDKKTHERKELNQDQTPKSWIRDSVVWVSTVVTKAVGSEKLKKYLSRFNYGNQDSSGTETFWNDSSLKISAEEQTRFLRSIWTRNLVSEQASAKAKTILFVKTLENGNKIYGKTGTCCIDLGCQEKPARQLGWFSGVMVTSNDSYSFALNFSDLSPVRGYAGHRARAMALKILEKMK